MARVTVEDCIEKVPNRFDLVMFAAHRARTISTGAPLTGDTRAWAERMDKGMGVLVDNVVNGFGGMPPFGLCMDCDADQFEALIVFMAEGK